MSEDILIVLLIGVAINVLFSLLFKGAACKKGYKGHLVFWVCFFVPPIGWIYTCALPDLAQRKCLMKMAGMDEDDLKK